MSWFYWKAIVAQHVRTCWRAILTRLERGGYQSYHQFGLAADVAFKRNGKVVISERDPWAMQGYRLYGQVAESVGLTWGGRWKSIQDYGHTEFRMPGLRKTQEMAEKLIAESSNDIS